MPSRKTPLVDGEIYHITNRGVAYQPIFLSNRDYQRALDTLFYYQNLNPPVKYSRFMKFVEEERFRLLAKLKKESTFLVEIITYCFIPNHFHLLIKQVRRNGISTFVGNFTNSYTRYFNIKNKRNGHLFGSKFNSVRMETDNQLAHVARYIHLNPYTSHVVSSKEDLEHYPYSSLPEYLGKTSINYCSKEIIINNFKSLDSYRRFVLNQADYQRSLGDIKHLLSEHIDS